MAGAILIGAVALMGMSGPAYARQETDKQQQDQQDRAAKKKQARNKQQQAPDAAPTSDQQKPVTIDQQAPPAKPRANPPRTTGRSTANKPKQQTPVAEPVPIARTPIETPEPVVRKPKQQKPIAEPVPIARAPRQQKPRGIAQPVAKPRLPQERQQVLIQEQKVRSTAYYQNLQDQQRIAEQRAIILRQQNRIAQYRYQQQYYERLRQQQSYLERNQYSYAYNSDPFYYTAPSYRYARNGNYYETNRYGVDLLRQAVNYGYQQGLEAGRADRSDRWGNGYEDSFAYQDANYGYRGYYVEQGEYNNYFREGFSRGYEDGYNSRYSYGRRTNGTYAILTSVLAGFLVFETLNND